MIYCKYILTYFEYFRHSLPHQLIMVVSTCRQLWCLSAQQINFTPHFFLEILQTFQTCYFGCFYARQAMPRKMYSIYLQESSMFNLLLIYKFTEHLSTATSYTQPLAAQKIKPKCQINPGYLWYLYVHYQGCIIVTRRKH